MLFDPNSRAIQLCSQGMQREAEMEPAKAKLLFMQAWEEAADDFEKLVAAHYIARHQESVDDKLRWDELALSLALEHDDQQIKEILPSLYLNIGKCYEDVGNYSRAQATYYLAEAFVQFLPDNGYGQMIKSGIKAGLIRSAGLDDQQVKENVL